MTANRIHIILPDGRKVRTVHSRRYFVVAAGSLDPYVVKRTDNLTTARRAVNGWSHRYLYDSTTQQFIR
jgi:hypothetical protein